MIKGGREGADVVRIAGEDLCWPVQGGGHHDEGVHGIGTLLRRQHQYEIRCYIRDPDGYLIEVGQTTDPEGDRVAAHWPPSTPADAG